jgi:hypothetical protein
MTDLRRHFSPFRVALLSFSLASAIGIALHTSEDSFAQGRQGLDAFRGVTTNGTVTPGLFAVRATGVSTAPVRAATQRFLAALTDSQRTRASFKVDDNEWRSWNNVHRAARLGISFREMTESQRTAAIDLLRASLSAKGLENSLNIMRLNETIGEMVNNLTEYGEHLYYITVMGTPSEKDPWGWQLEGHHLVINYFVLGDQVVMTPTFMGSEPVIATTGKYAGTSILQTEERKGVSFMRSLNTEQRQRATIEPAKTVNNAQSQAGRDNLVLAYAGIKGSDLNESQQRALLELASEFINNMDDGHARVKMDEIRRHVADTWFAWVGDVSDSAVFYYRIHSPVILIEFDHQTPVALPGPRVPGRQHIHTVVRTPNGNDYGKDLLRQHLEAHRNDPAHRHDSRMNVR